MGINLGVPTETELKPKILVFGVGGAGGNAVNNMITAELQGVEFVVGNTDAQALEQSRAERRIQLGMSLTHGLGAGSKPDIGRQAAEESIDEIIQQIEGSHMCFITAGMGGGTGTGAASVVARVAREMGILSVGVVTKPFQFEGTHRMNTAEAGIEELQKFVDTLIIIPNQNLFRIANEKTTFADAFNMADEVLHSGVRGVTDLMVMPGLINLDFADVKTVMSEMGKAMMGTGEAGGEKRAVEAAEAAISNPLLDDVSMQGARGVLINITGGMDLTLYEVDEAANRIRSEVDPNANIIVGSTFDQSMEGSMRVSVVATGIDVVEAEAGLPGRAATPLLRVAGGSDSAASIQSQPAPAEAAPAVQASPVVMSGAGGVFQQVSSPVAGASATAAQAALAIQEPEELTLDLEEQAAEPEQVEDTPVDAGLEMPVNAAREEKPSPVADGLDAPFIAPEPRQAAGRVEPVEAAADPFREAELANGAAAEPKKRLSLFERMTGVGRSLGETLAASEAVARPAGNPAPQPEAPVSAPEVAPAEARAPRLDPIMPADRPAQPRVEEDLLDIPAFLRRQAN